MPFHRTSPFLDLLWIWCLCDLHFFPSPDVIENGPRSNLTQPGHWANFTCTVSCAYNIQWWVEGYRSEITSMCGNTDSNMMICTSILQDCSTSMSTSGRVGQLRIRTDNELAGRVLAVQCVAERSTSDSDSCNPSEAFSRFAFLNGKYSMKWWIVYRPTLDLYVYGEPVYLVLGWNMFGTCFWNVCTVQLLSSLHNDVHCGLLFTWEGQYVLGRVVYCLCNAF